MTGRSYTLLTLLAAVAMLQRATDAAPISGPIIVRGSKMYNANTGERFFIKGLTYEYAVSDEYYDKYSKATIAKNLAGLKYNTLRLYNINPGESYKNFMNDMAELGIYVMVSASPDNDPYYGKYRYATITKDLTCSGKVSSNDGTLTVDQTETCYQALLLEYGKKIIQNFAQYDNTLSVVVANEIMQEDLRSASCVKSYVSDLKNWMMANGKRMRLLPLSYAAADSSTPEVSNADDYHVIKVQGLLCGDKMVDGMMAQSIDIYLINEYRWCTGSTFGEAYQRYIDMAQGIPIVVAFGEYGCKTDESTPRDWGMVPYMYELPEKTDMFSEVWSGGLAYSYGEAKLGTDSLFPMFKGGSTNFMSTPSYKPLEDYTNLKSQFDKYLPYEENAKWTDKTKCKWSPPLKTKTQSANKLAFEHGWIVDSCTEDFLKLVSTDSWVCSSREGVVCTDNGETCDVSVKSSVGTTQEDICGGVFEVKSGGGTCESMTDCGGNGQCVESNGTMSCKCLPCYAGTDCSIRDISSCATLSSSNTAPNTIFVGVGAFVGVMAVVFIALGIAAAKKKAETNRLAQQVSAGSNAM